MILSQIATIQTGLFAKPIADGEVVYLQVKHFDDNGMLVGNLHPDLKEEDISQKHLLRQGDILFASKGSKIFATEFDNISQPAVASTSFFVIRQKEEFRETILPEFLVWYLNNPTTQTLLKSKAIGTSLVSISKSVLDELDIPIPEMKKQHAILKIARLRNKEKVLQLRINELKEKQIQQLIIKSIS
ncbi:MAG: restriction endonuclease subunit S [Ignavibacteria bacterium]|nr:restriction endonuclease subunit S [Ignavibacteria bacterium]